MRRWLAIPMMLLMLLPFAADFFGASAEASIPACCRRGGRHQCSMGEGQSPDSRERVLREKCPYSCTSVAVIVPASFTPAAAAAIYAGVLRHPSVSPQTDARHRISYDRARQKRGPPSLFA
jgi:hypothetical protein